MDFKDKLVIARAKLNLSQEILAKELKVSYVTINRWENGRSIPTKKAIAVFNEFCKQKNISFY